jgi:hypothetical protein
MSIFSYYAASSIDPANAHEYLQMHLHDMQEARMTGAALVAQRLNDYDAETARLHASLEDISDRNALDFHLDRAATEAGLRVTYVSDNGCTIHLSDGFYIIFNPELNRFEVHA